MDGIARRGGQSSINDCNRPRPAGGAAANFHRKTAHSETLGRHRLEIVKFLDMTITDLATSAMSLPDQRRVVRLGIFFHCVDEWRVPTPAIGAGHAHATLEQIKRRLTSH